MMKHLAPLALALLIGACGEKNPAPAAPEGPPPAADPAAADPTPAADPAPTADPAAADPTPADEPAAPAFDAAAAATHLEALGACSSEHGCDAYAALVAYGPEIGPLAYAFALDAEKPAKARGLAMTALGAVKADVDAGALYAAFREAKDRDLNRGLEALLEGTKPDDDALAQQLRADVLSRDRVADKMAARRMLRHLPSTHEWALTQLEGGPDQAEMVPLADLVSDLATPDDAARLAELIPNVTDPMAKHRLAATAIAHGDKAHFGVLLDGLRSEDVHDRSDAANMLARVVKELPAELKAEALELLKAGKERDPGGLTARGYDTCLKALGEG